jgi:hypothetical protein
MKPVDLVKLLHLLGDLQSGARPLTLIISLLSMSRVVNSPFLADASTMHHQTSAYHATMSQKTS